MSFKLNQDYIAKNLCVERDIKDSDCKGCCQLKKKQAEQSENEETPNPQRNLRINMEWFCNSTLFEMPHEGNLLTNTFVSWSNLYQHIALNDCFHPPRML